MPSMVRLLCTKTTCILHSTDQIHSYREPVRATPGRCLRRVVVTPLLFSLSVINWCDKSLQCSASGKDSWFSAVCAVLCCGGGKYYVCLEHLSNVFQVWILFGAPNTSSCSIKTTPTWTGLFPTKQFIELALCYFAPSSGSVSILLVAVQPVMHLWIPDKA